MSSCRKRLMTRHKDDFYPTPPEATRHCCAVNLADYLGTSRRQWRTGKCCRRQGIETICSDLNDYDIARPASTSS